MAPYKYVEASADDDVSQNRTYNLNRDIFQRYNDDPNSVFLRRYMTKNGTLEEKNGATRQTSQSSDKGTEVQTSSESGSPKVPVEMSNAAPPAPAPPPPPPPTMNGCIPTIRLKSEISEHCEPPAKLHNAMMKDKKPFTYTPGGIDLSEIKSPRMQRRIVRNAQTPDDIILPTTTTVNPNTLPPSAVAAMTPQIAIPVFPQNGLQKKSPNPPPPPKRSPAPSPTPKAPTQEPVSNSSSPQKQQVPRTVVVTKDQPEKTTEQPRVQVGSLYVPPVTVSEPQQSKPAFPTLREAPTPWLQKHQQPQEENKPAWVNRNKNNGETEQKQVIYERKPRVQQVQVEKESVEPEKPATGTRVIPIQLEGSNQTVTQPNSRQNSQRWVTDGGNQAVLSNNKNNLNRTSVNSNKSFTEPDSKPIQSRSFKVLQKITGSEDDTTDFSSDVPYNTEGVPLSQLRRLHLCDDDQAFMNKVKSQANGSNGATISIVQIKPDHFDFDVDEDIFLHTETDPRYRGSAIPSKAFRMLQNMTESGQVIPTTIEVQNQAKPKPSGPRENENEQQQKKYIPPSERQAEQEFRKYMGSSIPSRSFRMLQAMTATQDTTTKTNEHADTIGEETRLSTLPIYPNPWPNPPKNVEEINLFWIHYMYLFNLVLEHLPHKIDPDIGDFHNRYSLMNKPEVEIASTDDETRSFVCNGMVDEYSENECRSDSISKPREELIITEVIKDDSENDVSLTISIPLRKKSKTVEYHEEVTIKNIEDEHSDWSPDEPKEADRLNTSLVDGFPDEPEETDGSNTPHADRSLDEPEEMDGSNSRQSDGSLNEARKTEGSLSNDKLDNSDKEDSRSLNLNVNESHSLSDSEHSESSSVDFWKEIADEDDMFYKHRPVTPFERHESEDESESECDDIEDFVDDSKDKVSAETEHVDTTNDKTDTWRLGEDEEKYGNYMSTNSESNATTPSDDRIDQRDAEDRSENDSSDDSSDENDSYNMYEFSYTPKPADEPIVQTETTEDPVQERSEAEDSGMTSDAYKYPPEAEPGTELRKLSKYQRANTHSRLLRILLDEEKRPDENKADLAVRKESLTLPLSGTAAESISSSSGINSPMSPVVNEKLVNELVQSLLKCNKGLSLRKLSPEKLRQAAIKSLQAETSDTSETSSPFPSDKDTRSDVNYTDYYDSWDEHSVYYPGFDILPSRAFKILQSGRSTPTNWPKCPLISNHSPTPSGPKINTQDAPHNR